eukprot:gnl/MRDRNA2_/MRDRNA2_93390_c0_seq1.p1 gnl/MRDRNA2_/MRDRNA2_93390_c0~~gnl/MRDRNA2_/MRDRNA2_93390_c0_seq1.p1  ORF type:complete len:429 (+),score=92.24 gnl/MRDRNA2_/MRDRNA2_93390_c0_seq1:105-1391(+)
MQQRICLLYWAALTFPIVSFNAELLGDACDRNQTSTLPFFSRALSELNKIHFWQSSDSVSPCVLSQKITLDLDGANGKKERSDMHIARDSEILPTVIPSPSLVDERSKMKPAHGRELLDAHQAQVQSSEVKIPVTRARSAMRGLQASRRIHESSNKNSQNISDVQGLFAFRNLTSLEEYYNNGTNMRFLQENTTTEGPATTTGAGASIADALTTPNASNTTTLAIVVENTTTPVKIPEAQLPMDTFVAIVGGVLGFLLCCGVCCALGLRKYFQDHWVYGKTHNDINTKCCGLCYSYDEIDDTSKKKQKTKCCGLIKVKDYGEIRNTAQLMAQKAKREKELKDHQAKLAKRAEKSRKGNLDKAGTLDLAEEKGDEAGEAAAMEAADDKAKDKEDKKKKKAELKGKKGAPAGYPSGIPPKKGDAPKKDTE